MKTLTEELIQERLEEKGIGVPHETPYLDKYEKVLEIYDAEITHDWDNNCTAYFYEESTADGYGVYISTEDDRNININEDLHYYESDWFNKLADYITNGCRVYIEMGYEEEYQVQEVFEALFEEWYMEMYEEIEDKLKDEGYEYPESE